MRRVLWLLVLAAGSRGEDAPPTPEAINRAIDAGVAWLKTAQKEDGSFGPCVAGGVYGGGSGGGPCYRIGPTAFALFTLATCGVPRDDAVIKRGLEWLRKHTKPDEGYTSYEASAITLMLVALNGGAPKKLVRASGNRKPPKGSRFDADEWRWMDEQIQFLHACWSGGGFGYWSTDTDETYADVSATQFAALALRAASLAGYPVEASVWRGMVAFHFGVQDKSGGFPYHKPTGPSRGMTAAALSSLLICREQLALAREKEEPALGAAIENGFRYLDANFDAWSNPSPHSEGANYYHYCHLYAVERTGILSGRRELGGKDWYMRGATFLLHDQTLRGRWVDMSCMAPQDVLGTCFALLFLKKATIPAVTGR